MKILLLLFAAALLVPGCATRGPSPVTVYDFGLAPGPAAYPATSVLVSEVRGPDWLETTDMLYRLTYRDARNLARYGASRWAGTPGAMLSVRLRQAVGNGMIAKPRQVKCVLGLSLSEFSQVFDSENASRATLHLQATLTENQTGGRSAAREFRIERPTPTPDAAGNAAAFADIAGMLSRELENWIAEAGFCKA